MLIHYAAHRLAWVYVHGIIPSNMIDHINGDKDDNRIANLREATSSQNQRNTVKKSTNKSGYKGVCWHKRQKKWQVSIRYDGKPHHIGYFDNVLDASNAYIIASNTFHGEFSRTQSSSYSE